MIASGIMLLAICLCSCGSKIEKVGQGDLTGNRNELPVLVTDSIVTLISDSGVTRYRIESPLWLVYDKTDTPYQEFPKGIYLEQFDEDLTVQASLKADYGYYNETEQRWMLRGNVHSLNRKGEEFDTQELNWSQEDHRVYSDSAIHVTRAKTIIEGVGFESNEEMTKYTILNPTGVFPIEDEEKKEEEGEGESEVPSDSLKV